MDIKTTYFTGMFLNFVFSAACKQKKGGGNKQLSDTPKHNQAVSKHQPMDALQPCTPKQPWPRQGGAGARPFQRDSATSFKYFCPSLCYQCGLFVYNGHECLGTAHSGQLLHFPLWGLVPLSQAICPYLEQQGKIKGRMDSVSQTVFICQQQKRAKDDQMFRSISSCETFEKTHSKSSEWVNLWASRPAPPQTWSLVPVYCWTHWSVYSPFIIHEKSQWSSQYIRRNNSDHLSTALLFLFPSPWGFHLLRFFLN